MKLNDFDTTVLKYGHCIITFRKPLIQNIDRADINLLIDYFGQKQHKKKLLKIYYSKNPWTIKELLVRNKKHWASFMEKINLNGREWYSRIRDKQIPLEEGLQILDLLAEANRKAVTRIKDKTWSIELEEINELK